MPTPSEQVLIDLKSKLATQLFERLSGSPGNAGSATDRSLAATDIVGIGVGTFEKPGTRARFRGLQVYVRGDRVRPDRDGILAAARGTPIQFLPTGIGSAAWGASRGRFARPLVAGLSVSTDAPGGKTGTIGGFVSIADETHLVTAGHVAGLVRPNDSKGKDFYQSGEQFRPIGPATHVASATPASYHFDTDSVVAKIDSGIECVPGRVNGLGRVRGVVGTAKHRDKAFACGMWSGPKWSKVRSVNATLLLEYAPGYYRVFNDLIIVDNGRKQNWGFAAKGDSGAWAYDARHQVIGMVVWADRRFVAVVPMQAILTAHNAMILK